jgi:hypothetical protein
MSQVLRKDLIKNLAHSAGNITVDAGSRLTIGGQQYTTSAQLSVALPSLTANGLYFIYATLNAGVPQLTISQNVNSVGPVGFASWKLIGALYANGMSPVAFGSFVNIEGSPQSEVIDGGLISIDATTTAPTKGATSLDRIQWRRNGDKLEAEYDYVQTGAGTTGSGEYIFGLPSSLVMASFVALYTSSIGGGDNINVNPSVIGYGHVGNSAGDRGAAYMVAYSTSAFRMLGSIVFTGYNAIDSTFFALNSPTMGYKAKICVPIAGWNNKSLKDL